MSFLSLPFSFNAANLRPNDMLAGVPAMSAVAGLVHNIQRIIQGDLGFLSFRVEGFALIYLGIEPEKGTPRRPPQESDKALMIMPALFDIRRGYGEAVLIVKWSDDAGGFDDFLTVKNGMDTLDVALSGDVRFCGGEMTFGLAGSLLNEPIGMMAYENANDVFRAVESAYPRHGHVIQDMSGVLSEKARKEGTSTLQALTDLLYACATQASWYQAAPLELEEPIESPAPVSGARRFNADGYAEFDIESLIDVQIDESDGELDSAFAEKYRGALLPVSVGFHGICEPRGEQYFVEPVLSLAVARSLRDILSDCTEEAWQSLFWVWEHLPQHHLYRAVGFDRELAHSAKRLPPLGTA